MKDIKNFSINNKDKKWLKILVATIFIFAVLFVLNIFVLPIRNYFLTASGSIQKSIWLAGESSSKFFGNFFQSRSLTYEIENLKKENQNLLYQIATLQSIEQGNRAQSDVSISCQNSGFQFVMAGVTGLDKDILSISKGSADGILEGMPVINQQNVLVGKIFKVYKNFSDIMLVSNKNSVINVKVSAPGGSVLDGQPSPSMVPVSVIDTLATSTPVAITAPIAPEIAEIDGVVRGDGGLSAHLDLIPINSDVNPNDILVTSALEKSFPKDLLLGKVIQMTKNDQKPFQQGKIILFFDVKKSDNLFVITDYKR